MSSTVIAEASSSAGPSRSPILARSPMNVPMSPSQPQFAELLTPARLRKKRRHAPQINVPPGLPELQAGPSTAGYQTLDGDLYRGATTDPTMWMANLEEDAVTIGGSSTTSSSSSWSLGSDIERGRKATMAALGRFGEAIGVRRGSDSSTSSVHELRSQPSNNRLKRTMTRTLTRRLSRSKSRGEEPPEKPKREYVPKRREFTLLLPASDSPKFGPSGQATPRELSFDTPPPVDDIERAAIFGDRLITTPALSVILERIRTVRTANGMMADTPPSTPGPRMRRGISAPSVKRHHRPGAQRGANSFMLPPVPRPPASRMQSRVDVLKQAGGIVRPKSVSDLMGMAQISPTASKFDYGGEESPPMAPSPNLSDKQKGKQKAAWWLDVSCPGWEDLRDIGELLSLHPLTLEDVLQQDPREKVDFFEKLGYYFLVVRSLDESYFKYTPGATNPIPAMPLTSSPPISATDSPDLAAKTERRRRGWGMGMGRVIGRGASRQGEKVEIVEDEPGKEGLEGVGVGAVDVYMAVFADGIVTFHFGDVSKHTKRVLDRILSEAGSTMHTSDWVAHGILDSIVDAFFPLIRFVDGEVDDIDSLTIDPSTDPRAPPPGSQFANEDVAMPTESIEMDEKVSTSSDGLKTWRSPPLPPTPPPLRQRFNKMINSIPFAVPRPLLYLKIPLLYLKLAYIPIADAANPKYQEAAAHIVDRSTMLSRMTKTRKLVSGLSRLLGAKHAVVARLRKRDKELAEGVDVEDHILLLQTSLHHYEYILAHCQPAYLSHLSVQFSYSRGFTDKAILALSVVSISVLPMMVMIGMFSMNVSIPHNGVLTPNPHLEPDGSMSPFNWFAGIVTMCVLMGSFMMQVIRYWRFQARTKWAMKRGEDLPSDWDVYWGWK